MPKDLPMTAAAFDLRIVHLLHSRVLHDLANTAGAISNGLELVREAGGQADGEAMALVDMSAKQLQQRIRFYRVAFGLAPGAVKTLREMRDLLTPAIIGQRNQIDWPEAERPDPWAHGDPAQKMLLNMILLASEALPRGGTIAVYVEPKAPGVHLTVTAAGQGVRLEEPTLAAIAGTAPAEQLTPKTAHGFFAARLAEAHGARLTLDYPAAEMLALRAALA